MQDRKWMRRAIALARLGEGHTRPNPPVGAVVVKNGRKLGEGRHCRAGLAHAEVEALNACRGPVKGATMYVTLEPCSTHGRTPPCTDRILEAGIARVAVGCHDPNARHRGRGIAVLAARGVEVTDGVLEAEARELILPFAKHITTGTPFLSVKLAMTLDGRIADRKHQAKWITGETARAEVQRMRKRADAVMVGAGTVCADDPSLLCRLPDSGDLIRVVVDATGRTPAGARVYTDSAADRTIVATTARGAARKGKAWTRRGARVWTFAPDSTGRVPLRKLMKKLGREGYLHVLCEGGGTLAGGLNDAGLVDEFAIFYAPAVLGDARAVSGLAGQGSLLSRMTRGKIASVRHFGEDLLICLRPERI
ncbi:MAG: bifunctional diaminohydroxyphosphoribosylaminopyrimidine deaminase/5-amino-6-(5-phosphoribosylamino)uracil reductase RibD [Kiritimatiellae bacterium]|nr:bifunctional diaminohydroxyphosphoribosylaminopyrimidine deaminase/5-amino-6-(5-phosphoribosylamino)uracil reductase RibD [Kiritimatiellia bacterium]MDD3546514.1 bifunctional diaminohydroxyphosphoribosylaminopyrimidine deaminase/5-amino-6-(5-phosphoribosylamino)uracil reductase RibD [Kiritimatiellia bacterium]MDD4024401.1 bifunctional diaminohydroxyphosphoribosylaminopyrimidine deaminase/5-amino-6-(5-phosphoribosylamino)uracil reductase RibD [Kiritimatiellia bacterium]